MHILIILLGAAILYYLQLHIYKRYWHRQLSIQLKFASPQAMEGDDLYLTETISNGKLLPLPVVRVKFMVSRDLIFNDSPNSSVSDYFYRDDLVSILMYQRLTRTLDFHCSHRGYYTIKQADIVCNDPFFSLSLAKHMDVQESLYVYPRQLENCLIQIPFSRMIGTVLTKRLLNDDPFEFSGIREYQIYDSMKNINWKASAKTGELKVNVHDYTASQQVLILLNLEAQTLLNHDELMEESIRLTATYANAFIQSGIPVAVYTNGLDLLSKEPVTITAGSGNAHMSNINEGLARIDLKQTAPCFLPFANAILKDTSKQDYLLLISTYQKEDLQDRLIELKQQNRDFTWIVPLDHDIRNEVRAELDQDSFPYLLPETA